MTTVSKLHRLCGWSVRCGISAIVVIFCASAFAGPKKDGPVTTNHSTVHKVVRKVCYVHLSVSAIPQPCDWLGAVPTTAIPMDIIGTYPVEREIR